MNGWTKTKLAAAVSVVAGVLLAAGCTGQDKQAEPAPAAGPTETTALAAPAADVGLVRTAQADPAADAGPAAAAGRLTVVYTAEGEFVPKRLDIETGETVTFVNASGWNVWPASNIHPTHEILPEFDPQRPILPGESWSFTFDEAGYWRYHNHELATEVGMIVATGGPDVSLEPLDMSGDFSNLDFPPLPSAVDPAVLLADEAALLDFVQAYGPLATVGLLSDYELSTGAPCHNAAHVIGRIAYEEYGPSVFAHAGHRCSTGLMHGLLEAMFAERGTANLEKDMNALCLSSDNTFFRGQCWHGVGHGIMAWTSYELHDALDLCRVADQRYRASCLSGVFMENTIGGMSHMTGHSSRYIRPDDLHFPCAVVADEYVSACYGYQPVHMLKVLDNDYFAVSQECSKIDEAHQPDCFRVFGNAIGARYWQQPATAAHTCGLVSDDANYRACVRGIISEAFWGQEKAAFAIAICNATDNRLGRAECWNQVLVNGRQLFTTPDEREELCAMFAAAGRDQFCREQLGLNAPTS